jgi:nucleotide-binding universal stress UspA family protein
MVCGVDGTESASAAMAVAADMAARLRLRPIAVRAHDPSSRVSLEPVAGPPGSDPVEEDERRAWALLTRAVEELGDDAEGRFVLGRAAQALQRVAARERSRLIVVGSTGGGMLRSLLLGSVSAQLVSTATTPVLIVPRGVRRWPRPGWRH